MDFFFFQAEDGIRDADVTGVQTCALPISYDSERIHGISTLLAETDGVALADMLEEFNSALKRSEFIVGQNVGFDINVMGSEFVRLNMETPMHDMPILDTCTETTAELCRIPGGRGGKFKLPTLTELHEHLFDVPFNEAHNATADVEATARSFFELVRRRIFTAQELHRDEAYFEDYLEVNTDIIQAVGLKHENLKKKSQELKEKYENTDEVTKEDIKEGLEILTETQFVHLHNHSQFSVLQSTSNIKDL